MLWARQHSIAASGCPIADEKRDEVEALPEARADQRKQARKAMAPATQMGQEPHQKVSQQRRPYLPLDGLLVMADEVNQLHRLLDLLKEHFDLPSCPIQLGHGPGAPDQVVGDEGHHDLLAVHLDDGLYQPQPFGVPGSCAYPGQFNDLVAKNTAMRRGIELLDHYHPIEEEIDRIIFRQNRFDTVLNDSVDK